MDALKAKYFPAPITGQRRAQEPTTARARQSAPPVLADMPTAEVNTLDTPKATPIPEPQKPAVPSLQEFQAFKDFKPLNPLEASEAKLWGVSEADFSILLTLLEKIEVSFDRFYAADFRKQEDTLKAFAEAAQIEPAQRDAAKRLLLGFKKYRNYLDAKEAFFFHEESTVKELPPVKELQDKVNALLKEYGELRFCLEELKPYKEFQIYFELLDKHRLQARFPFFSDADFKGLSVFDTERLQEFQIQVMNRLAQTLPPSKWVEFRDLDTRRDTLTRDLLDERWQKSATFEAKYETQDNVSGRNFGAESLHDNADKIRENSQKLEAFFKELSTAHKGDLRPDDIEALEDYAKLLASYQQAVLTRPVEDDQEALDLLAKRGADLSQRLHLRAREAYVEKPSAVAQKNLGYFMEGFEKPYTVLEGSALTDKPFEALNTEARQYARFTHKVFTAEDTARFYATAVELERKPPRPETLPSASQWRTLTTADILKPFPAEDYPETRKVLTEFLQLSKSRSDDLLHQWYESTGESRVDLIEFALQSAGLPDSFLTLATLSQERAHFSTQKLDGLDDLSGIRKAIQEFTHDPFYTLDAAARRAIPPAIREQFARRFYLLSSVLALHLDANRSSTEWMRLTEKNPAGLNLVGALNHAEATPEKWDDLQTRKDLLRMARLERFSDIFWVVSAHFSNAKNHEQPVDQEFVTELLSLDSKWLDAKIPEKFFIPHQQSIKKLLEVTTLNDFNFEKKEGEGVRLQKTQALTLYLDLHRLLRKELNSNPAFIKSHHFLFLSSAISEFRTLSVDLKVFKKTELLQIENGRGPLLDYFSGAQAAELKKGLPPLVPVKRVTLADLKKGGIYHSQGLNGLPPEISKNIAQAGFEPLLKKFGGALEIYWLPTTKDESKDIIQALGFVLSDESSISPVFINYQMLEPGDEGKVRAMSVQSLGSIVSHEVQHKKYALELDEREQKDEKFRFNRALYECPAVHERYATYVNVKYAKNLEQDPVQGPRLDKRFLYENHGAESRVRVSNLLFGEAENYGFPQGANGVAAAQNEVKPYSASAIESLPPLIRNVHTMFLPDLETFKPIQRAIEEFTDDPLQRRYLLAEAAFFGSTLDTVDEADKQRFELGEYTNRPKLWVQFMQRRLQKHGFATEADGLTRPQLQEQMTNFIKTQKPGEVRAPSEPFFWLTILCAPQAPAAK